MNNKLETSSAQPNHTKSRLKRILALAGGLFVYGADGHMLDGKAEAESHKTSVTISQTRSGISTAMADEKERKVWKSDKDGILILDKEN